MIEIKNSEVSGRGVFAAVDIKAGTLFHREVFSFNYDLYLMHCTLHDEHTQKMLTVAMDMRLAQFIQLANDMHDAVAQWGQYVRFNNITLLMNEMLDTIDHSIVFLSDCFQEKGTI